MGIKNWRERGVSRRGSCSGAGLALVPRLLYIAQYLLLLSQHVCVAGGQGRTEDTDGAGEGRGDNASADAAATDNQLEGLLVVLLAEDGIGFISILLGVALLVEVDDVADGGEDANEAHLLIYGRISGSQGQGFPRDLVGWGSAEGSNRGEGRGVWGVAVSSLQHLRWERT